MFCKYCGAKIEDGALFCSKCGQKTKIVSPNTKNNEKAITEAEKNQIRITEPNDDNHNNEQIGSSKPIKIVASLVVIVVLLLITIIPIVNHYNNNAIDSQLDSLKNANSYFINAVTPNDSGQIIISFSDGLDWKVLDGKKIYSKIYIMESGAVVDMDKNGAFTMAKGYSGYYPGESYSAGSKQERAEVYGDSGYYNLCIGSSSSKSFSKDNTYIFDFNGEKVKYDDNRIYNFSIELHNENDNRLFYYDSYFRYNNGKFTQVKIADLKPEDTYYAWKDNELHFAKFSSYSNDIPPVPCFYISDETYDSIEQ